MLTFACLLVVLGIHVGLRVMAAALRAIDVDPWDALLYLGLAEVPTTKRSQRPRLHAVAASAAWN